MEFKVWAPNAGKAEIVIDNPDNANLMEKIAGGWWCYDYTDSKQPVDYGYILDGGGPFPDPRSPYQPGGVHGLSRTVDHSSFEWTDDGWQSPPLSSAIIYELHTGTFTSEGTFEAIISKLDYLKELGITHIELMPVNEFSGDRNWGYDGVDIYAPHHEYGGPEGLKTLVNAAHGKGLGVVLDVVYNHFGPEGNYLEKFGGYLTDKYSTPWGKAVNFDDAQSNEVRSFVIDNALMWLGDYHIDGLRIDAVHSIFDDSAKHILEELSENVEQLNARTARYHFLIAESDLNDPRVVRSPQAGGYGIDAQWSDDFHHCIHSLLTGELQGYYLDFGKCSHLAKAMEDVFVCDGVYSHFRRRVHGRRVQDLNGYKFVVCSQNHDQVGNRAVGDRLCHLVSPGKAKIAAAIIITSPFIPMLFQGEEWAASSPFQYFTNHQDEELGKAVTEGRKSEFSGFEWSEDDTPDPQAPETFQRSKLDWGESGKQEHSSILGWYKELIKLRKSLPELQDGNLRQVETGFKDKKKWLVIKRGSVKIFCNFGGKNRKIPLDKDRKYEVLLSSDKQLRFTGKGIKLSAESVAILKCTGSK
jgi:maltooligosyltrehalose trehalohydrolase